MATYQWKFLRGNPLTVKMDNVSVACTNTYVPVGLTSNLMVEPQSAASSVFGVMVNQAGASVLATDANDPPVVLVSEDAIYEVRCTGDLALGDQVQVTADNNVEPYISADLACGVVVDYNPASSTTSGGASFDGYSICHIKPFFISSLGTGYLNKA